MKIQKKYHFYAGHRNLMAGEKCSRLHGHTYEVSVFLRFPEWQKDVAILFQDIDAICEPYFKGYDHHLMLSEDDPLVPVLREANEPFIALPFETSAENLVFHFFQELSLAIQDLGQRLGVRAELDKIELAETKSSTVSYESSCL